MVGSTGSAHRAVDLTAVPHAARSVARQWSDLAAGTPDPDLFDPDALGELPDPVRRWVCRTIEPGVPLARSIALAMHGQIRLGSWRPFTARQVLTAQRGFVWSASTRIGPAPVSGFDRYADGAGQMRWRLFGVVPVMGATGPDVTRSAAGRLAVETMLTPTAALAPSVHWHAVDDHRARADVVVQGASEDAETTHHVEVTVDEVGHLTEATVQRWGNPLGEPFGLYPFGARFTGELPVGGVLLAHQVEAGWFPGTDRWADGVFFRATLDHALLL